MKTASFATSLALAATLLGGTAIAQTTTSPSGTSPGGVARPVPGATGNAPMPGVNSNTGVTPNAGVVDRNTGTAAAAGDRNQGVATTSANAPQPARGRNSFTEGEARRRIERNGYQNVTGLKKDDGGVWRGNGMKDGQSEQVWLDYKGNAGPHPTPASNRNAGNTSNSSTRPMGSTTGSTAGSPVGGAANSGSRPMGGTPGILGGTSGSTSTGTPGTPGTPGTTSGNTTRTP